MENTAKKRKELFPFFPLSRNSVSETLANDLALRISLHTGETEAGNSIRSRPNSGSSAPSSDLSRWRLSSSAKLGQLKRPEQTVLRDRIQKRLACGGSGGPRVDVGTTSGESLQATSYDSKQQYTKTRIVDAAAALGVHEHDFAADKLEDDRAYDPPPDFARHTIPVRVEHQDATELAFQPVRAPSGELLLPKCYNAGRPFSRPRIIDTASTIITSGYSSAARKPEQDQATSLSSISPKVNPPEQSEQRDVLADKDRPTLREGPQRKVQNFSYSFRPPPTPQDASFDYEDSTSDEEDWERAFRAYLQPRSPPLLSGVRSDISDDALEAFLAQFHEGTKPRSAYSRQSAEPKPLRFPKRSEKVLNKVLGMQREAKVYQDHIYVPIYVVPEKEDTPTSPPTLGSQEHEEGGNRHMRWTLPLAIFFIYLNAYGWIFSYGAFHAYYAVISFPSYSSGSIAWIIATQLFLTHGGAILVEHFIDRNLYFRICLHGASALLMLGAFLTSICKTLWHCVLAQGVILGFGNGLLLGSATAALRTWRDPSTRYNDARLIRAAAASGTCLGGVIFSAMFRNLTVSYTFTSAVQSMAFVLLATLTVPNVLLRPKPAASRMRSGGGARSSHPGGASRQTDQTSPRRHPARQEPSASQTPDLEASPPPPPSHPIPQPPTSPTTTLLAILAKTLTHLVIQTPYIYTALHSLSIRQTPPQAIILLIATIACSLPTRLLTIALSNPLNQRHILATAAATAMLSAVAMLVTLAGGNDDVRVLEACLFGLGSGAVFESVGAVSAGGLRGWRKKGREDSPVDVGKLGPVAPGRMARLLQVSGGARGRDPGDVYEGRLDVMAAVVGMAVALASMVGPIVVGAMVGAAGQGSWTAAAAFVGCGLAGAGAVFAAVWWRVR